MSIELAKQINGEIISADSMQIYKEMNIGTAKPTNEERQGIKHYMLDIVSPNERYSVSDYKKQAQQYIDKILQEKKTPIIVGGTGLYINALIYEIEFGEQKIDEEYRNVLEKRAKDEGLEQLYQEAVKIDKEAMKKISQNDKKRIFRVLEIYHQTGKTKTEQEKESRNQDTKYDYRLFIMNMDREILYNRINFRVDKMIQEGLIEEVKEIQKQYKEFPTAMQGIGYKEVVKYLQEEINKDEMIEIIKQESRRYAKRQLTWFRKNEGAIWLDALENKQKNIERIMEEIKK